MTSSNDREITPAVGSESSDQLGTLGRAMIEATRETHHGLAFKAGDRVMLTVMANRYYGGVGPWTPEGQGGGLPGTVGFAGNRPHKPGADPRPYFVDWDNGASNSYREGDLKPA